MGVKYLWNLLTPYCEKKPLFELNNTAVAIDLSGWVCESLNVVDYFVHPRFYLRNLFFRTCYLLQTGIIPVFVLEGSAPPLKYGVIIARNHLQFRGARPRKTANCDSEEKGAKKPPGTASQTDKGRTEQKRNRFHHVLKQCEELLSAMGIVCVQAPGEAEALCAYLNHDNLVAGVISQDSDCFAYGAERVYRNFCASQNGGSVDIYDLKNVRRVMDLGQEKIVTMAILSGCDYNPAGVVGVGREMVNRFLGCYSSDAILNRIRSWRDKADRLTDLELKVEDKNVCADCGHQGKVMVHRRNGCQDCRSQIGCDEKLWREKRNGIKAELDIRRKALVDPQFPPEAIIDEFTVRNCELPALDLEWKQPNLVKFIRNISNLLQWNEIHSFQKLLPLFTRWQTLNLSSDPFKPLKINLHPDYIKKKRSPKGVASYEIVWLDKDSIFTGLIPDEQLEQFLDEPGNTVETLWSTIEPQNLVDKAYSHIVEKFTASKAKPKKRTKRTQASQDSNQPSQEVSVNRKPKARKPKDPKQKRLEEFLSVISGDVETDGVQGDEENGCRKTLLQDLSIHLKDDKPAEHFDSIDLDQIINDPVDDSSYMNISDIIDRVCAPTYGRTRSEQEPAIQQIAAEMMSMSIVMNEDLNDDSLGYNGTLEPPMEQRLLLKQDVLNATMDAANQSLLNGSIRAPRKRKSFFFEPITADTEEMDMFECSLMLKDRIVIPVAEMDQTIVWFLAMYTCSLLLVL
ncbi:flap endonuclease GEN isoform X2 [Uranotaenia lowii]|uniref:flap endonuclease GEN isoform X2 n=1 Tax=Uranotaenia lowii TaxID=190385 RepID=UPI002478B9C0|nr:flap endonuclease GEN isoform X2 [Uranotaenia lowii]